jgi:hypothetical protein
LFDRGISRGETPRLVAHVVMGRDKRIYRFVQDTRFDRIVLAESHEARAIVDAVTECRAPHGRARTCVRPSAGAGPGQDGEAQAPRFLFVTLGFVLFALALFLALRGL